MSTYTAAAAAAKSLQSCPTLCDPIDGSPPGSPVPGILQARTLEWVAIFFSNARKWKVKVKSLNHVRLLVTPWTAAYQAPPSMGFSRQEYWSGVPLPSPITNTASLLSPLWPAVLGHPDSRQNNSFLWGCFTNMLLLCKSLRRRLGMPLLGQVEEVNSLISCCSKCFPTD